MIQKRLAMILQAFFCGRDDKIRTCDHTPPRRVLYRAELHPAFFSGTKVIKIFNEASFLKPIFYINFKVMG